MTNRVLLNNVDHHDLRVIVRHAAEFGDGVNQIQIFPTEFEEVQREYPILFSRSDEGVYAAVALVGIEREENLFLGPDGSWEAWYVPALQRRGPFSIGLQQGEGDGEPRPMIHLDLDDARVGREEGEPLFLPQGGNSPYLADIVGVLSAIFEGHEAAPQIYAAFEQAGLFRPVNLEIDLGEERKYRFADYFSIDQERMGSLSGTELEQLNRAGHLRLAMLAAASLGNVHRLIARKSQRG